MKRVGSPRGRVVRTASNLEHVPIEHEEWWQETVRLNMNIVFHPYIIS